MPEYLWYTVAAVLAGVSTGLVGLSAATAMVPIIIVLCPSFAGESGVYQATAIALASDILGSAVTTATYIRHKNIDLKRGWIMLVCIIGMCTIGSFAAWKVGNVVLGGYTLFLTFCIGIRFLVKPSTEREDAAARGERLNWKGVVISLFFGLSIGFGTGFVGSGGGMMMLLVFTVLLGMELKVAVGTSTFIMTFTALIASVSHIMIHPAILLERWPVLLYCMALTTTASLWSARFANRVDNRAVGLSTGAILTVMGALLIILNYWKYISKVALVAETLICLGQYLLFVVLAASSLIILNFTVEIPRAVFRKLLHIIAFVSTPVVMWLAPSWQAATLTLVLTAAMIYPALHALQSWKGFDRLFVQKKPGEVKRSLLLLFLTDAALVAVCWGRFKLPYIAVTAIVMWGAGDGAAALIGKRFGKRHVTLKFADRAKTWAGSGSMAAVSAVIGTVTMLVMRVAPRSLCLLFAAVTSLFGAYTELISHNGIDTVTVPVVNMIVLLLLHFGIRR